MKQSTLEQNAMVTLDVLSNSSVVGSWVAEADSLPGEQFVVSAPIDVKANHESIAYCLG